MNIIEIIEKKKDGHILTYEELEYAFMGYLNGEVLDYQMSSLLMAITINSMSIDETLDLTDIFIKSGDMYEVSSNFKNSVDKHSTGGIGDTTTLIVGPIIASLGLKMAKMSGRGLGLTGGTIDKLESIPGFNVNLSKKQLFNNVKNVGFAISAQTDDLTPLDKVIYELRDVTGTTKSIPLIAASIMSKKIALGAKSILIDCKYGTGALLKDMEDVILLDKIVSVIAKHYNRNVRVIASNMDTPLSYAIGNSIEVLEAIDVLKGKNCPLLDKSLEISAHLVSMNEGINYNSAYKLCRDVIENKKAYHKFEEFIKAQGGSLSGIPLSSKYIKVKAKHSGYIKKIDASGVGALALNLGCGKKRKEDKIDYSVGIMLNKKVNDYVKKDETLMYLYVSDEHIKFDDNTFDFISIEE